MTAPADNEADFAQMLMQMNEAWRAALETSGEAGKAWSQSMMPFLTGRAAEGSLFAAAQGGEIAGAIKRLTEGPRLADIWDLDQRVGALTAAWIDMRQRMAHYHAVVSVPWNRAAERYGAVLAERRKAGENLDLDWRKAFSAWSTIANEEMIKNQRSAEFLAAQRDLLRAALDLRKLQQGVADTAADLFGLPSRREVDELSRQLTELRRELRAHLRGQRDAATASRAAGPDPVAKPVPKARPGAMAKSGRASGRAAKAATPKPRAPGRGA